MRLCTHPTVVFPGQTITAWSHGLEEPSTAPTAVAVDGEGRAVAYGTRAVREARDRGLRLVRPFTPTGVPDPELAQGYLRWIGEMGRRRRGPIALLVPSHPSARTEWNTFATALSPPGITLCRPLALTAGLGLEVAASAHMVVIVEANGCEIAVVADGAVVFSHHTKGSSPGWVASEIRSSLLQIDPDLEWDVAEDGIHAVGSLVGEEWAGALSHALGMAVGLTDLSALFDGARASLEVAGAHRSAVPWRLLRPGAGLFAR